MIAANDEQFLALLAELTEALADLDWCRLIRNQYSHCQWFWTAKDGLCFVNLKQTDDYHVGDGCEASDQRAAIAGAGKIFLVCQTAVYVS
jgi:hypothetical protein